MRNIVYNVRRWFVKDPKIPNMTKEQVLGLLSQIWENDAHRRYLQVREQYLKDVCAEKVLAGKIDRAEFFAGQMFEVRTMAMRYRGAYNTMKKRRDDKRDVLAKERKTS